MSKARWQFRLSTLLWLMIFVGLVASLWVWPPLVALAIVIVLTTATPGLLAVEIVCGSGYRRLFCLGAIFPSSALLITSTGLINQFVWTTYRPGTFGPFTERELARVRSNCIFIWALALLCGCLCCLRYRMIERKQKSERTNDER